MASTRVTRSSLYLLIWALVLSTSCSSQQERAEITATDLESGISINQQQQLSFGQRPTQFIASPQMSLSTAHSRGALIMPANNQIQASSFRSPSHPLRYQPSSPAESVLLTTELAAQPPNKVYRSSKISSNNSSYMDANNMRNSFQGNIELALRQTSSDENVFQPSPGFGVPAEQSMEWLPQSSSLAQPPSVPTGPKMNDNKNEQPDLQLYIRQQNQSSQVNNIVLNEISTSSALPRLHETPSLSVQADYESKPQSEFPSAAATSGHSPNGSTLELSNNVYYEGPATAPPVGDYYFSSSEKLPSSEKASNVWWSLGFGHESERASNLTRDDYLDYCTRTELLITSKQRLLCKTHPKIMSVVVRGLKMAIDECQFRFTSSRWNCSLVMQNSLNELPLKTQVFGDVMKHANRERSFLNAIIAAGLAHAMTKACSQGEMPEECSCDKRIRSKNNKGKIEWVACSDDIDFGARFSRDFTDNTDSDSDTTSMINAHNYEVGRRVFKSATDITCSCQNGENGLCQTKRCWKHQGPFSDIGDELMKRYEGATHVQLSNRDPHKLRPVRRGVRKPKRKDLVYIDESPDYCNPDTRLGVLGTQNRRCNSTSLGPDSCSLLCCGRGYQVVVEEIEEDCNCKFVWCCQVKCDKCKRHVTNDVCN